MMDCCERHSTFGIGVPSSCEDIMLQISPSFPDSDKMAFVLSLTCLSDNVHGTTLKCVVKFATGHPYPNATVSSLQEKLKSYIYNLQRGKLVYQSVVHDLSKNKSQLIDLNRAHKLWPQQAETMLKDNIKLLFEEEIKARTNIQHTCACCSMHYTCQTFSCVPISDLDLGVLETPEDWEHVWNDRQCDGALASLLLDKSGVFVNANESCELTLCNNCHCALQKPHMPKFALANYLSPGTIPDILRDLTPVEESMVTLCCGRCIMVQLKTMHGGLDSQCAFCGHMIFHLQNPGNLAMKLPPSIEDILAPICILFVGAMKLLMKWIQEHAKLLVV